MLSAVNSRVGILFSEKYKILSAVDSNGRWDNNIINIINRYQQQIAKSGYYYLKYIKCYQQ